MAQKYKVGDRVRIKSTDWYNKYKDEDGVILCGEFVFLEGMKKFCSETLTISEDVDDGYLMFEDYHGYVWTDEMIEGLVEEEVGLVDNLSSRWVNEFNLPEGYIFKDENGNVINATKIVLEKKKKEYPKTYEECCEVLDFCGEYFFTTYEEGIHLPENDNIVNIHQILKSVSVLTKLLICRNAYWKIAGDEMGLGKPWEPDDDTEIYNIYRLKNSILFSGVNWSGNCNILEFPTEEMRDAFYENFKEEIEICKELL